MTIVAGFKCANGIVLCADSLEEDGISKKFVQKIWAYQVSDEWGIAVASAGEADLADSFTEGLKDILGNSGFEHAKLLSRLRVAVKEVRESYPESQLAMVIGVFSNTVPSTSAIYRVMDRSLHVAPVTDFQTIGIASGLTDFLCKTLYSRTMFTNEALRLGAFCIARAKEHFSGCGGPTSFIVHTIGSPGWEPVFGTQAGNIEADFPSDGFAQKIREYWKEKNPKSTFEEITGRRPLEPSSIPGPKIIGINKLS
jgi:20S proteasome alpha/beta subunit